MSCAVAVETSAVRLTSGLGTDGVSRTANTSIIVFNAYTYFNETSIQGLCSTIVTTITLTSAYSVTAAATVSDLYFPASATSEFFDFLDFSGCGGEYGEDTVLIPVSDLPSETALVPIQGQPIRTRNSTASGLSTNLSNTAEAPTGLPTNGSNIAEAPTGSPTTGMSPRQKKIALGAGISVGSVLIALCLVLLLRRYRRNKRSKIISSNDKDPSTPKEEDQPPYLQPKGELDAHGNSKFELSAEQRQYELEGHTEIHEMPTGANTGELSGGCGRIELRGAEHSQELKA
ncbi:MAG: hypothetical protein Q9198_007009 [Flavoplaca austrocitrina]